tara:strand:- start:297 stop:824 length:528 start_codon:yes stop_codon:yes gene_type:complete
MNEIIIVDNSSKETALKNKELLAEFKGLEYIHNSLNNLYLSYNIGIERLDHKTSDWVTFRTDDDRYYEKAYLNLLEQYGSEYNVITGPYWYEDAFKPLPTPERPLSTCIFNKKVFKEILFNYHKGADWEKLKVIFNLYEVAFGDEGLMRKREHSKSVDFPIPNRPIQTYVNFFTF